MEDGTPNAIDTRSSLLIGNSTDQVSSNRGSTPNGALNMSALTSNHDVSVGEVSAYEREDRSAMLSPNRGSN